MRAGRGARLADAELHEVAARLGAFAGLTFPAARRPVLRRAVETLLGEHPDAAPSLAERLEQPGVIRERLIELATVGETFFFRDLEQLEEVRRSVLAPLVAGRLASPRPALRIWSAGCATGEEVYSVAVLVAELLDPSERWDVRIVGSDIDRRALDAARAGRYGRWSFRAPLEERERWFMRVGNKGQREVSQQLRPMVQFVEHNLVASPSAPPAELGGPADMVLLRNVLLYLDAESRARAISVAREALRPGGWLLVAPIDARAADFAGLERVTLAGRAAFRRPVSPDAAPLQAASARKTDALPAAREAAHGRAMASGVGMSRSREAIGRSRAPVARSNDQLLPAPPRDALAAAWRLADAGDLPAAAASAAAAQAGNPRQPGPALCLATIAEARGDVRGAREALRKLLTLAPDHPAGNLQLALLDLRAGRSRLGRARLRAVVRLVEPLDPDAPLADLPGGTAADVRRVASSLLGLGP